MDDDGFYLKNANPEKMVITSPLFFVNVELLIPKEMKLGQLSISDGDIL